MTRRGRARWLAASVAVALALSPLCVRADMTKAQCIDANTSGQDLRRDGKFSAASEQLRACAIPSCPALVRDDCTKRLDDVERAQPAIVFDVKDAASGRDVSVVKVTVDGRPLAEKLDGTALPVDPGEHVFVFTVPDQAAVTRSFVLKEGDKERRERIEIGQAVPTAPAPPPPNAPSSILPSLTAPPSEAGSGGGMGAQRILGLVAGFAGVGGVVVGSAFGLLTQSEVRQQQKECPSTPNCMRGQAETDHSNAIRDRAISTVGFAAGGALLVTGVALFFTGARSSESRAAAGIQVLPSVGPAGGGMALRGEF
jgi:hypothetical protein